MAVRKLKLGFKDNDNNSKMITIDYPKSDLEATDVESAMDTMIGSNVILTKKGQISTKSKAYEEIVEKNEFEI